MTQIARIGKFLPGRRFSTAGASLMAGLTVGLMAAAVAIPASGWLARDAQAAEARSSTLVKDAIVYREPDAASEVLGKYRKGKALRVTYSEKTGWFSIAFAKPVKGASVGWISPDSFDANAAASGKGRRGEDSEVSASEPGGSSRGVSATKHNWISLGVDLFLLSPGVFQTALGDTKAGVMVPGFWGEYGHWFGQSFAIELGAKYLSFSKTFTATGAFAPAGTVTYFAKGYSFEALAGFALINNHSLALLLDAGAGIGFYSAGNNNITKDLSTTNIPAVSVLGKLQLIKYLGKGGFAFQGELGYQLLNLSAVPIADPTATTSNGESTADVALGGLFFGAGIALNF